jgi:hypothetical protein
LKFRATFEATKAAKGDEVEATPLQSSLDIILSAIECFKATIKELEVLCASNDHSLLVMAWDAYQRSFVMLENIETNLFTIFEEYGVDCKDLRDLIIKRHQLSSEVAQIIKSGNDVSKLTTPFAAWKEASINHFGREHSSLIILQKKIPDPQGWAEIINEKLITPALMTNSVEFEYFVGWCAAKLSNHGSSVHLSDVAVETYLVALRSACGPEQWIGLLSVLHTNCKESIWNDLIEKHQIDSDAPGF